MRNRQNWTPSAVPEKLSEASPMRKLVTEMFEAIVKLAGDRSVFETRDLWLASAARKAGISTRMAKALFYRESKNPSSAVVESVRAAVNKQQQRAQRHAQNERAARREYADVSEIIERLERLERTLRLSGADHDRVTLVEVRKARRGVDRAVD